MTIAIRPNWTVRDSSRLYNIDGWGSPYFGINASGRVEVRLGGDRRIELPAALSRSLSGQNQSAATFSGNRGSLRPL
ncbi:hypothetical protein [Synechococcus sp. PCC 7336]|uniref:hypothetical protein n=1 Tax=Synechococcus sp. PCC 7336 TaxID=195250 RepID=UPI00034703A8|nr:hypothetical protein [Synechococcus sp. PCC 7336]